MAGIIVELIISWLLLWLICRKHLSVLGYRPTKARARDISVGFMIAASCCTIYLIMTTSFSGNSWMVNTKASVATILEGARWTLVSVLYEELIFRGALLYIAIKKLGVTKACIISAVCFGIYHWFTFNAFGNPIMMAFTFLMTGIIGLSWALAFAKTQSLYLPVGLHFGWNLFYMVVFSNGQMGNRFLFEQMEISCKAFYPYWFFYFKCLRYPCSRFGTFAGFRIKKNLLMIKSYNR
jgi:membrane protease YdiL (CAAX protease family)